LRVKNWNWNWNGGRVIGEMGRSTVGGESVRMIRGRGTGGRRREGRTGTIICMFPRFLVFFG